GLPFYTIGQRKGLGISYREPLYVLRKDVSDNALVVGTHSELGRTSLLVRDVNWVAGEAPPAPIRAAVKSRYKAKMMDATVEPLADGRAQVTFDDYVFGSTAGQGAVFYDGEVCLGGGLISDSHTISEGVSSSEG